MPEKIPCTKCQVLILPTTAQRTGGLCMPCKQGYREDLKASKEFYKQQNEYDPHRELWHSLLTRISENGINTLSKDEKIYYYIGVLDGEVYNGGMHQFFTNSSGDRYHETLDRLNLFKAQTTVELLKKAKTILFGNKSIPENQNERNELIIHENEWSEELDLIDDEYYKDIDNISEKMYKFAEDTEIIKPFIKTTN